MKRRQRLRNFVRQQIAPLVLLVLVLTSFRSALADWNIVPTGSMNPSIIEGDRIFVNKLAYGLKVPFTTWHLARWSEPARGDIVVLYSPLDGVRLVKRVVGLPGEEIAMRDNTLFINGTAATYTPIGSGTFDEFLSGQRHRVMTTPWINALRSFGPVTIPPGHYFVLGDNRDNSADSRFIGPVPRDNIVGRSSAVVVSLDPNNHLPRWERTLHALP